MRTLFLLLAAAVALPLASACTVSPSTAPSPSGPSELALSFRVTATPDTVPQDGVSSSQILVQAFNAAGQPLVSSSPTQVRLDMQVGGNTQDFGAISPRVLTLRGDGSAIATYVAPPASGGSSGPGTNVTVFVTPISGNASTATPIQSPSAAYQTVIRLTPVGQVTASGNPVAQFTFSPAVVTLSAPVQFDASASCGSPLVNSACPAGASAITSYNWQFGDGTTATGKLVSHTFSSVASFPVTLTVVNSGNLSASTTQQVGATLPAQPTANFSFSPNAPVVGQTVNFNGSGSLVGFGHTVAQYTWVFGDGTVDTTSGITAQHAYSIAGIYNVSLTITDDAGQRASATNAVTVGTGTPTAVLALIKSGTATTGTAPAGGSCTVGAPCPKVQADASASFAAGTSTISTYTFIWGDGTQDAGSTTAVITHIYPPVTSPATETFTVTVKVTDSLSRVGTASQTITVP